MHHTLQQPINTDDHVKAPSIHLPSDPKFHTFHSRHIHTTTTTAAPEPRKCLTSGNT